MAYVDEALTDRQREVLGFYVRHWAEHGRLPTVREAGQRFGIKSTNGVNDHLIALARKGYLHHRRPPYRGFDITEAGRIAVLGRPCLHCAGTGRQRPHAPPVLGAPARAGRIL